MKHHNFWIQSFSESIISLYFVQGHLTYQIEHPIKLLVVKQLVQLRKRYQNVPNVLGVFHLTKNALPHLFQISTTTKKIQIIIYEVVILYTTLEMHMINYLSCTNILITSPGKMTNGPSQCFDSVDTVNSPSNAMMFEDTFSMF